MKTTDIVSLAAADTRHGGKAEGLAALIAAGLPVPPGIVLDARSTPIPDLVEFALRAVAEHGWRSVAIRSSGRDEDRSEKSSAGAYRTVLGVAAEDTRAVAEAVEAVVASMGDASAGVVVQQMVHADAAGVAFTIDPVTGTPTVVVDAVPGLGEVLVSGAATPWEVRIRREDAGLTIAVADEHSPIDDDVLAEVVRLALAAEDARGGPQDVEWAVEDGHVWLLQSRPVTALPLQIPIEVVVPAGFWARDPSHGRLPRTAMLRSVVDESSAFAPSSRRFGVLVDFVAVEIGGWTYMGIQPVGGPAPRPGPEPKAPPGWLVAGLLRLHPEGRRGLRAARAAYRTDAAGAVLKEWRDVQAPYYRREIMRYQGVDLGSLEDEAVALELERRAEFLRGTAETHFSVGMPYGLGLLPLIEVCLRDLGWTADQAMDLLSGLADVASEPARELAALAALPADGPERGYALERFQRFYGCRALDIEISEPTLAESPGILGAMIGAAVVAAQRADAVSAERAVRIAEARELLGVGALSRFDDALARAEEVYGIRDDNVFLCIDAPLALVRYAALEAGGRLAARGALDTASDVFHLTIEEAVAALREREEVNLRPGREPDIAEGNGTGRPLILVRSPTALSPDPRHGWSG